MSLFDSLPDTWPLFVKEALRHYDRTLPSGITFHTTARKLKVISDCLALAKEDEISARDLELLLIAATFTDFGYLEKKLSLTPTAVLGASDAARTMSESGQYTDDEISLVRQAINDTRYITIQGVPPTQRASTRLSPYLLDAHEAWRADGEFSQLVDKLSNELGLKTEVVYAPLEVSLEAHRFQTRQANERWEAKKQENILWLRERIKSVQKKKVSNAKWLASRTILCLAAILVLPYLIKAPYFRGFELAASTFWFRFRGATPPNNNVLVAVLDDTAADALKLDANQAFPRTIQSEVIDRLQDYGARLIVLDINFTPAAATDEINDQLAESLAKRNVIIATQRTPADEKHGIREQISKPDSRFSSVAEVGNDVLGKDDSVVRRFPQFDTLVEAPPPLYRIAAERMGVKKFPAQRDLINYYGERDAIAYTSYEEILEGQREKLEPMIRGNVVFVGYCLSNGGFRNAPDYYLASYGNLYCGVHIHATAAANAIEQRWIHRLDKPLEQVILSLAIMILGVLILFIPSQAFNTKRARSWATVVIGLGSVFAVLVGSYAMFLHYYFIPPVTVVFILVVISILAFLIVLDEWSSRERRIEGGLDPEVVRRLSQGETLLPMPGPVVAILWDMEKSSVHAHAADDKYMLVLKSLLNRTAMNIARAHGGVRYADTGDGAGAVFGRLFKGNNPHAAALKAAEEIEQCIERLRRSSLFPSNNVRIGAIIDKAVEGLIASSCDEEYGLHGSFPSNLARLDGIIKAFGRTRLLGSRRGERLKRPKLPFKLIYVGEILIPKDEDRMGPMNVYALCNRDFAATNGKEWQEWYRALRAFRRRHWDKAHKLFSALSEGDYFLSSIAAYYVHEIERLTKSPPDDDWRGVLLFSK